MSKLPALKPDDPLAASTAPAEPTPGRADESHDAPADRSATPHPPRATAATNGASTGQTQAPSTVTTPKRARTRDASTNGAAGEEGEWSGSTDVTTLRVPVEVLHAMRQRSRDLGLPKGMMLTAGLLDLLERSDEDLIEVVEATQLRYDRARRRANRSG